MMSKSWKFGYLGRGAAPGERQDTALDAGVPKPRAEEHMHRSAVFIRRPIMASLLMAAFILAGLFGYSNLPVSELPNVDFPTIDVNAGLPGADPETMASSVATPLEKQFSLIAGVDSMTSSSGQGTTRITLQFQLDLKTDAAYP